MRLLFLLTCVGLAPAALAQGLPDASMPDASVGEGGVDQTSEENDADTPCLDARDCPGRFICDAGRCVPGPVTRAGCGGATALAALSAALVLGLALRPARAAAAPRR